MSDDSVSEVSSQSWFGRMGNAIKGMLIGIVLFVAAFPLLWWNEGRALRTAQGLRELGGVVVSVPSDKVDAAFDQKPVHMTGMATTDETLADSAFGVSAPAIRLRRAVQMYQWKENESRETRQKLGGGSETKTTWTYEKTWSDQRIDSNRFKKPEGHANPDAMRFTTQTQAAKLVRLGAFKLSAALVDQMKTFETLPLGASEQEKLPADIKRQAKVQQDTLYLPGDEKKNAVDPAHPEIGDLQIRFEVVRPGTVSLIAQQLGDSFEPWRSGRGTTVERLVSRTEGAANMIGAMESENVVLTWLLRLAGFLLMALGLAIFFNPIKVMADVIPLLGDLLGMGVALFAAVVAACLSLVTIAVAWLAYRPLLGIGLVLAAVLLILALRRLGRKRITIAASA